MSLRLVLRLTEEEKFNFFLNYWMMCVESSEVERHLQEKILQILTGRIYYINIYPHLYALNSWNFPTKTFHLPSQKCVQTKPTSHNSPFYCTCIVGL